MRTTLLTPLLLASALAQDGPPLDIATLELSGTGCPAGTYDIDIMAAGGFIFHAFNATLDGAAACRAEIGVEVTAGYRVVLREVAVTGDAGLDVGVVARVGTTASWGGSVSVEDEQVLYGSAVGVDFPNSFVANPIYEDRKSACKPGNAVLSIDVEVELEREEEEGEGVVTVEFVGLRIAAEACGDEVEEQVNEEHQAEKGPETPENEEDIPEKAEDASDEDGQQGKSE